MAVTDSNDCRVQASNANIILRAFLAHSRNVGDKCRLGEGIKSVSGMRQRGRVGIMVCAPSLVFKLQFLKTLNIF